MILLYLAVIAILLIAVVISQTWPIILALLALRLLARSHRQHRPSQARG